MIGTSNDGGTMNNPLSENRTIIFFITLIILCCNLSSAQSNGGSNNIETNQDSIKAELSKALDSEFKLFYPLSFDTVYGGYFSDINYKWQLEGKQDKMIVTQSRHIWANANAALFYPGKEQYKKAALQGFDFIKNVMWDKQYGGFFNIVNRKGKPYRDNANGSIIKLVYGNSFALFALSAYYKAFGDTAALNLAVKTFKWIEDHCYDPKYGGYFQFVTNEGDPLPDGYKGIPPKDQNSMIHVMESFTELYSVWPDKLLKERLIELFLIIRDKVAGNKGYMTQYFLYDMTPVSYKDSVEIARRTNFIFDHISFGHDVETAYLMLYASKILGIKNDTATLRIAKELVDFTLNNGWDTVNGGIYDRGYVFNGETKAKIVLNTKEWWSQIEALNSLLLMYRLFPGDRMNYYEKFCIQWNYIKKYIIDNKYGGWYWNGIDTDPRSKFTAKATIWKCDYHTTRGLINCINMLNDKK